MNIPNITGLVKVGKTFLLAHRPELLLGTSITATIGAVVLAAKGGYEARGILDEQWPHDLEDVSLKTKAQLTWHCYVPAAVTTVGALGATTGLHLVHVKEKKALVAAGLAAIEEVKTEAKEFQKELEEVLSPEQKEELQDRIFQAESDEDGVVRRTSSDGEVEELYLVRDAKTGRDIWSNKTRIEDALVVVNDHIARQGDCELNTFYSLAGYNLIPDGDDWGWSGEFVELQWGVDTRDDGRPVRTFSFHASPTKGYDRVR